MLNTNKHTHTHTGGTWAACAGCVGCDAEADFGRRSCCPSAARPTKKQYRLNQLKIIFRSHSYYMLYK
jgi:hypothetical protein